MKHTLTWGKGLIMVMIPFAGALVTVDLVRGTLFMVRNINIKPG